MVFVAYKHPQTQTKFLTMVQTLCGFFSLKSCRFFCQEEALEFEGPLVSLKFTSVAAVIVCVCGVWLCSLIHMEYL